jgi:hypothetical protein
MLKLSDAPRLPRLANHCFIVGEAKRADVIWSEGDFEALCEHMLNENPDRRTMRGEMVGHRKK